MYVTNIAQPEGGGLIYHLNGGTPGGTVPAVSVKAAPGVLYSVTLVNVGTSMAYFRPYDLASAPTASSATGAKTSIPIPYNAASSGAGITVTFGPVGAQFNTGIGFVVTGGNGSDTDNTAAPAGIFITLIYY